MKRDAAKFVPRLLSEDQKANRLDVCREMKDQLKTDADFLSKIITGDESWCLGTILCRENTWVNNLFLCKQDEKQLGILFYCK